MFGLVEAKKTGNTRWWAKLWQQGSIIQDAETVMYKILQTAHDNTKKYLAELRKKENSVSKKDKPQIPKSY